jgi:RimJ/RimL family protein N-acetyltransferase
MLIRAEELTFAKQPVIERSTGLIIAYAGVNWFNFEGEQRLEFGYRLVREARGRGDGTVASRAVLTIAAETFRGEVLAMIDPTNHASQNVALKLGFTFWKRAIVDGYLDNIYRLQIRSGSRSSTKSTPRDCPIPSNAGPAARRKLSVRGRVAPDAFLLVTLPRSALL